MSAVRGLFWNPAERRLRAPWRLAVTLSIVLLAAGLLAPVAGTLTGRGGAAGAALGVAVAGVAFLAVSVVVAATGWLVDRRRVAGLGLGLDRRWWVDCAAGLGIGAAMATAAVAVVLAAGGSVVGPVAGREAELLVPGVDPLAATALWGLFFLGAATLEEVLVRGYLLVNLAEGLAGRLGRWRATLVALLATSLLFGLLHAANPGGTAVGVVTISLAGLLLGVSVVATGRLGLAVGLHTAWNVAVGPVFGLPVSGLRTGTALLAVEPAGPALLTGGRFGPEGGLVMAVALAVGAGLLARRLRGDGWIGADLARADLRERPEAGGGADAADGGTGEDGA